MHRREQEQAHDEHRLLWRDTVNDNGEDHGDDFNDADDNDDDGAKGMSQCHRSRAMSTAHRDTMDPKPCAGPAINHTHRTPLSLLSAQG